MKEIILNQSQIDELWNHLKSRDHKRFFAIARYTGYKIKPICNLKVSDVYNVDGLPLPLVSFSGDNLKVHQSPVCDQLDYLLRAYRPEIFNLQDWLFPSRIKKGFPITIRTVDKFIRECSKRSSLNHLNVSPSSLRKAFIKHLHESGISSIIIKQLIGIKKECPLKTYSELPKGNGLKLLNNIF